jgi:CRP/FNR family cyclic AMP-dependent transcriptional regulator
VESVFGPDEREHALPDASIHHGPWQPGTLLAKLDPELSESLLNLGSVRTIRTGDVLTRQGDRCGDIYLLVHARAGTSASVKVTCLLPNGSESLLSIRMVGDIIGEGAALRDDRTRSATVTACCEIRIRTVERSRFLTFMDSNPRAWRALCALLGDRLEGANRQRLDFGAYDVRVRLARVILSLVENHGVHTELGTELGVELSQQELGKMIGAKPDAVNAALRKLKVDGLISARYRGVRVANLARLRQVADAA